MATLKNQLIFTASSLNTGNELWISDGTETGTRLLKDIHPTGDANPNLFSKPIIFKDSILLFSANDGKGDELWKTDGTSNGTSMISKFNQRTSGSSIQPLAKVDKKLFFSVDDGIMGAELWITDCSSKGTCFLKDIALGSKSSSPENGIAFNGQLFFTADDGINGTEVWKSDGTKSGTSLLKDIQPGNQSSFPAYLTLHNKELYFAAYTYGTGHALWKTDGSKEGTVMIKQIGDPLDFNINPLLSWGNYLYFTAFDKEHGGELWRSDGTPEGTKLLFDLNPGPNGSVPQNFVIFNNELYFDADDGVNGRELWKLNTSNVVGVSEPGIVDILVFSNPDTDHLSISGLERYQNVQVRLLDAAGRPLYSETMTDQTNSTIDVSNFPEGIYFLEMNTSETRRPMLKKVLIVR
jgi:ELWxxDGT repeat protein